MLYRKICKVRIVGSSVLYMESGGIFVVEQMTVREASLCQPQPVSGVGLQEGNALTAREVEIIRLMARGMMVKEIARVLQVSEKTVRNHLSNIYRKCNVYDRVQIVLHALKMGLVHLSEV